MDWYFIMFFNESRHYPRLTPFYEIVGIICLIVCIINLIVNIKLLFKINIPKWKIVLKHLLILIVSFIPMMCMWSKVINWLKVIL